MKKCIAENMKTTGYLLAVLILAGSLTGCAGKRVSGPVFWPYPPDPPRIQYLTGISDSTEIEEKQTTFSLVLTGGEEAGVIKKIGKAYGIAAHKGKLYIASSSSKQVVVIDVANKKFDYVKGNIGKGALSKPVNVDVGDDGYLYVTDSGRREIVVYDPAGNYVDAFGKGFENAKLVDAAAYGKYLYVPDFATSEIRVLDKKTGEQVNSLAKGTDPKTTVALPVNIEIDDKGIIYITNTGTGTIMKFDVDGNLLGTIGKMGDRFNEFARPRGVAVDSDGRVYVVDAGHGNVQIFDKDGRLLTFFGTSDPKLEAGTMNLPAGIAVSRDNLDFYQKMAAPGFKLEEVIFVVNQFGTPTISVYGLGLMAGADYTPPKHPELQQKKVEPAEKKE
jgi:DNA-binding beta-propeller fold protein YncE